MGRGSGLESVWILIKESQLCLDGHEGIVTLEQERYFPDSVVENLPVCCGAKILNPDHKRPRRTRSQTDRVHIVLAIDWIKKKRHKT